MTATLTRKRRSTGTTVEVTGSVTKCVDHGKEKDHKTHTAARRAARRPEQWCPTCKAKVKRQQAATAGEEPAEPAAEETGAGDVPGTEILVNGRDAKPDPKPEKAAPRRGRK